MNKHPIAVEFTQDAELLLKEWYKRNDKFDWSNPPKFHIIDIRASSKLDKHDVVMLMDVVL